MIKYFNLFFVILLISCETQNSNEKKEPLSLKDSLVNERFTNTKLSDSIIDLSRLKLKELPPQLDSSFSKVRALNISSNEIKTLPDYLFQSEELKSLDASFNKLETIKVKSTLSQLEYVNLYSNMFSSFPTFILSFGKLKELNLGENYIDSLPSEMAKLISLKTLTLDDYTYPNAHNKVVPSREISKIKQIGNIESLSIRWRFNNIIPDNIGELTNLKALFLMGGSYKQLPASLFDLSNLNELYLSRNQLKNIPAKIIKLKNLKILDLSNNLLVNIPLEIKQLSELEELNLDDNPINSLPFGIETLKLKHLSLIHTEFSEAEKIKIKKLFPKTIISF